ncbi:MAG: hypothetical protein EXR58_02875 [Chloroflexi bacterium]|nr:hypothetical protein [Chloroflexota bacterium]
MERAIESALIPIRNQLAKLDRRVRHLEVKEPPRVVTPGQYTIPRDDLLRMQRMMEASDHITEFVLSEDFPYSAIVIRRELEWLNAEMSVAS